MKARPPREERRQRTVARLEEDSSPPLSLAELMNLEFPPSSRDRFELLKNPAQATESFLRATDEFATTEELRVLVARKSADVIGNIEGMGFSFNQLEDCIERMKRGESLVAVIVLEADKVIAYGFLEKHENSSNFAVLEVEQHSKRKSGLSRVVVIEGEEFSVGAGHAVVAAAIRATCGTITTDATKSSSQYIFRSLGFVPQDGTENPCRLWLPR